MNEAKITEQFDAADACLTSGRLAEAEALYQTLNSGLPLYESARKLRSRAYERLVHVQDRKERFPDAIRVFREYLGDSAPRCDPVFDGIYCDGLLATQTSPVPLRRRERFFALVNLLQSVLPLDGLAAECGCFRGLSSYVLSRYIRLAEGAFDGSGYRIFDSFAGLSEPQAEDAISESDSHAAVLTEKTRGGQFAASLGQVKESLRIFPRIEYFPGWIPDAFPDEPDARYRFVHLDVDLYQPTRDGPEYFYPKLVIGGTIVCDDFVWPGARKAIAEYCATVDARFWVTPWEQAYIVRRG